MASLFDREGNHTIINELSQLQMLKYGGLLCKSNSYMDLF
jgi:hypothetical protein